MSVSVNANVEAVNAPGPFVEGSADARQLPDVAALEERAAHVAARLAEVANAKRLLILCHLAKLEAGAADAGTRDGTAGDGTAGGGGAGEASVGELQRAVGLSQSALSQHLARLRSAGMVATRRESQTIHYRLADDETRQLMAALYDTFCRDGA